MAIKASLGFSINFVGDGSTSTVVFDLTTIPIDGLSSSLLPFDISKNTPSDIVSASTNAGVSITSATLDSKGKNLTIVFSSAPSAGVNGFFVAGTLVF